jgi:hypothetical protein
MAEIYEIRDRDCEQILMSGKKTAPCNHNVKKIIMTKLLESRRDILNTAESLDDAFPGLNGLKEKLEGLLPSSQGDCTKNNATLTSALINMFGPFEVFYAKVEEQQQLEGEMRRTTRGASTSQPKHVQVIKEVVELKGTIDKMVRKEKASDMGKMFKPVGLTREQESRHFVQDRHDILDEAHKKCPYCTHLSTNSLLENDSVVADNNVTRSSMQRAQEVWNRFKAADDDAKKNGTARPPFPEDPNHPGKIMKMAPKEAKLKAVIDVCLCKNSGCCMRDSDHGSSCFIKCIDPSSGERYPWDPIARQCSCPICQCECPGVWHRVDRYKIAIGIDQARRSDATISNMSTDNVAPEAGLRRFLQQSATGGIAIADLVAKDIPENTSAKDREAVVTEALMEGMAMTMARNASSLHQSNFGQSTIVTLPNGQRIDTTSLGSSRRNLHTNNNRLGVASSTVGSYQPGMKNHYQPSFDYVTAEFQQATQEMPIADAFFGPVFNDLMGGESRPSNIAGSSIPLPAAAAASATNGATTAQISGDEIYAIYLQEQERASHIPSATEPIQLEDERKPPAQEVIELLDDITPPPQVIHRSTVPRINATISSISSSEQTTLVSMTAARNAREERV